MYDFVTMVMVGGRGKRLFPLTRQTNKAAIRFGGIYRIVDFTLSNCLNSGIRKIYLLAQYAFSSLERHIKQGWGLLFRSELDEFIEVRPPQHIVNNSGLYAGTADSVYQNLDLIAQNGSEGVLVLSGDHIYKMDYRKMIAFHHEKQADVTVACIDVPLDKARDLGVLVVDDSYRVLSFLEKPENPTPIPGQVDRALCNMGVYFFSGNCLREALIEDALDAESSRDFGKDVIPRLVRNGAKVMVYIFEDENKKPIKYWRDIGTLDSYFEASMDLVEIDPVFNLYDQAWPIRNFNRQLPPAKTVFNNIGEGRIGMALDSLLSPGVIISGGKSWHSILSPEVTIRSYSTVSNSILFDGVVIGRHSAINNAIIDSGVRIPDGSRIGVDLDDDRQHYMVTEKGVVVVTKEE